MLIQSELNHRFWVHGHRQPDPAREVEQKRSNVEGHRLPTTVRMSGVVDPGRKLQITPTSRAGRDVGAPVGYEVISPLESGKGEDHTPT